MNETDKDVVTQLAEDHTRIRTLFDETLAAEPERRPEMVTTLVRTLVMHEVAEEEIVYPVLRKQGPEGDILAAHRIAEQASAERLLTALERNVHDTEQAEQLLRDIQSKVLEHAEAEEATVFPRLRELDPAQRKNMGRLFTVAKLAAPTHPHPDAPDTPPGNLVLGPVVAVTDRARDVVMGALAKVRSR
jgi:hemerythrin superfamily protein